MIANPLAYQEGGILAVARSASKTGGHEMRSAASVVLGVLVLVVASSPACGGGSSAGWDGGDGGDRRDVTSGSGTDSEPEAKCLPPSGTDRTVPVTPDAEPIVVTMLASEAMNPLFLPGDPSAEPPFHTLETASCGQAALIWYAATSERSGAVMYQEFAPVMQDAEVVEGADPGRWLRASLFLDDACDPIVMLPEPDGYAEFKRAPGDGWTRTQHPALVDGGAATLAPVTAWTAPDGSMNVLGVIRLADISRGWFGRRSRAPGSAWDWSFFDLPSAPEVSVLRVGPDGTVHALYTRTEYPCDPCNLDLYYGRLERGGAWTEEVVQASRWGAPDDAFATMARLALDASGEPLVAAAWQQRAVTGSLKSSELRLYGRGAGTWCFETIADEVDGYRGGDGARMTGADPNLVVDELGRIHVVFQDLAQWHDGQGWSNGVSGQVRHAVRSGRTWTRTTLFPQKGQSEQARPLEGFLRAQVAVAWDGSRVWAAGTAFTWDTDSVYNQEEKALTLRGIVVGGTLGN